LEGAPGPDAFGNLSDAFRASDPLNTYRSRTRTVGRSKSTSSIVLLTSS